MTSRGLKVSVFSFCLLLCGTSQSFATVNEEDFSLQTTRNLYNICSVDEKNDHYVAAVYTCRGFMEGAVQYHDAVSEVKNLKRYICYPPTATLEEGRLAFLHWAKANSENAKFMGEAPVVGLVRSLAAEYPCKK